VGHTVGLAIAFFVAGVGLSTLNLAWNLTVQKVPEEMLSRVMAIDKRDLDRVEGWPVGDRSALVTRGLPRVR